MTNRRYEQFSSPGSVSDYLRLHLAEQKCEIFYCLFLDSQHRLLDDRELFRGTIDGCSVYPREVVKATLEVNAAAVILAHNHRAPQIDRLRTGLKTHWHWSMFECWITLWSAIKMSYRLPNADGFNTLHFAHDTTVSWVISVASPDRCRHIA